MFLKKGGDNCAEAKNFYYSLSWGKNQSTTTSTKIQNLQGGKTMGKYLVLWEVEQSRMPIDPKERGAGLGALITKVKQDIEKGKVKDWGNFVGEPRGYDVFEGTELELMNTLQQFVPFVSFKVHQIASLSQVEEMIKALSS
jgi:hypothetical protein